jgi:hypothetical protein
MLAFSLRWRWRSRAVIRFAVVASVTAICAWGLMRVATPGLLAEFEEKFAAGFVVTFSGEMTDDASANVPLLQAVMVLPLVEGRWLAGNGIVSAAWGGGLGGVLGEEYFHPSDIGILGVMFTYGLIGLILFGGQFYYAVKGARRARSLDSPSESLPTAIYAYVAYLGIRSLATGQFAFAPEMGLVVIAVLWSMRAPGAHPEG